VPSLQILADNRRARRAALAHARALGYAVHEPAELLAGDAAAAGRRLAAILLEGPPGVTIWGGETTVRLPPAPGVGGRNQHLALAAAGVLAGSDSCYLLAAGTDGSDGPTEDAGALVDGCTLQRASLEGFDAESSLAAANAGPLLEASGDLIATGPTGTNVMDLVIGLKSE
jgi:hydroxypyruvate reductase